MANTKLTVDWAISEADKMLNDEKNTIIDNILKNMSSEYYAELEETIIAAMAGGISGDRISIVNEKLVVDRNIATMQSYLKLD